jgi:hypothetical protein
MKPCSGVSAFADRNYGPDAKVGADEEGDAGASDAEDSSSSPSMLRICSGERQVGITSA